MNVDINDALKIKDLPGHSDPQYGIVRTVVEPGKMYHVHLLQPNLPGLTLKLSSMWFNVPHENIEEWFPIDIECEDKSQPTHTSRAWHYLGFQQLTRDTFVSHENADASASVPIGEEKYDFESCSDDDSEHSSDEDLKDFIVPDDRCSPFTLANSDDDEFVKETHACVRAYNNWTPLGPKEAGLKAFIDNLSGQSAHVDADMHDSRGTQAPHYDRAAS